MRPINLLIIGLTMYSVWYFFITIGGVLLDNPTLNTIHFILLVLSTQLVAGAGNVINDYFDVKADKINKPDKLFVTKYVSKRKAIILHGFLNVLSLLISGYLSIHYHTWTYFLVHVIAIQILWFYSAYFKRKFLIGNILIAGLTTLVIWQCGYYFYTNGIFNQNVLQACDGPIFNDRVVCWKQTFLYQWNFITFLCLFAFTLNLARELIKDLEDISGDKKLHAHTLAIALGIKKTNLIVSIILLVVPLTYLIGLAQFTEKITLNDLIITLPILIVSLIIFYIAFTLWLDTNINNKLKRIDQTIKTSMIIGVITPLYWSIF